MQELKREDVKCLDDIKKLNDEELRKLCIDKKIYDVKLLDEELKKFKYSDLKEMLFIELKHGNWGMTDIPTLSEINRIRDNIQTLKNNLMTRSTLTIVKNNTMNYNQAKNIHIKSFNSIEDYDKWKDENPYFLIKDIQISIVYLGKFFKI